MKLAFLKANESAWITIQHPTTADCGIRVLVLHRHAPAVQDFLRVIQKKRMDSSQRSGRLKLIPEDIEAEGIELLVSATKAWEGIEDEAGQPLACTPDAARAIYSDPGCAWLRKQVDEAMGETSLFFER